MPSAYPVSQQSTEGPGRGTPSFDWGEMDLSLENAAKAGG